GVATFGDLSVNKTGTGYTLTAAASGFAPVTSTAFDIVPEAATQVVFTARAQSTVAAAAISPAVQVSALDAAGNPAPSFTGSVTRSEESRVGKGSRSGRTTDAENNEVATFTTLTLDKTSNGNWVTATAKGLSNATNSQA